MKKPKILVAVATIALMAAVHTLSPAARAASDDGQPGEVGARAEVGALDVTAANLKLVSSLIVTQNNGINLSSTAINAFNPVTVTCPARAPKGCTVSVLVSSQFWAVTSTAQINTTITGSPGLVNPANLVNVDADTTGGLASTHTMQWMKTGITAGSAETVTIQFQTSGTAAAGYRTATVVLYKNV